jgi:hypothetical protein
MKTITRPGAGRRVAPAAVAALALAGCGATAVKTVSVRAATAAAPESTTLRLQSQLSGSAQGATPTSPPGSAMIFTGMLFQPKGAAAIGRSQGACTRTAPGKGDIYQCLLTFLFADGDIYAQSVASFEGPSDGVITGGTHRYAGAHGTFVYKATGNPRVDLTLVLSS